MAIHRPDSNQQTDVSDSRLDLDFKFASIMLCSLCQRHRFRPRRSRSAAGYSHQTFPVCLSSALCKNGRSDPDAIWHHRSDGSRNDAGSGVWGLVHGKGYFSGAFGDAIVTNGDFTVYVCDSVSTVGAAVSGGACGGPRHCCIR